MCIFIRVSLQWITFSIPITATCSLIAPERFFYYLTGRATRLPSLFQLITWNAGGGSCLGTKHSHKWLARVLTTLMSSKYTLEMASSSSKPHGWNFIILYRNYIICLIWTFWLRIIYLFFGIVHCGMFNYLFTHSVHRYEG